MPIGDLARSDEYELDDAPSRYPTASNMSIQPNYPPPAPPIDARWLKDAANAQARYRPAAELPDVGAPLIPSGPQVSAGSPWANRAADIGSRIPGSMMGSLLGMPQRLIENSQNSLNTGTYDPTEPVNAALGTMGVGGIVGVPVKGAETLLGAGAARMKPPASLFDYSRLHEVPDVPQFDLPRNVPPRGVPQRTLDITTDPAVRDKMLETISQGQKMGGANWYNAEPLRGAFNAELGSGGDAAFRKYMDLVAATSPRSDVGTNARNASYYYSRAMQGEPMPAVGDRNPQPYGHMAQRLHQMNAERVAGAGWDPLNNPKPASFVENLVGNQQPATIDTHAFRLPAILGQDPRFLETAYQSAKDAPKQNIQAMVARGELPMADVRAAHWQALPKANEYGAMERYYQGLGKELGLTPAQTQASAWVGGGKLTGLASDESKPFLRFLEDRINLTAEKRGETPQQTMKNFIRGKAPLLTVPPVMGALAAQDQYQPEERQ